MRCSVEVVSAWGALCRWYQYEVLCGGGIGTRCSVEVVSQLRIDNCDARPFCSLFCVIR